MSNIVFLAGLPRSGSTLVCNLLAQHPDITTGPSSALCHVFNTMRATWSDDPFLLGQLGHDFDNVYAQLENSTRAFMNEWSKSKTDFTIDKNRGWLSSIETLRALYPGLKMLVTIRNPVAVFASIEKRHRNTLMLDFPDHMEQNLIDGRANALFGEGGIIGGPMKAIDNLSDIPNIMDHVHFIRFEALMSNPQECLNRAAVFLGVKMMEFDFENIKQTTHEYDGFYRMKYMHVIHPKLTPPDPPLVSPRIVQEIEKRFDWFYTRFYGSNEVRQQPVEESDVLNERIASEIEEALNEESSNQ